MVFKVVNIIRTLLKMQTFSETDIFQTETERRYPDIVDAFLKIENGLFTLALTKILQSTRSR